MLLENVRSNIAFEIDEINHLFELYNDLLQVNSSPVLLEITSMASVLHSFYTGIEKIFLIIAKQVDQNTPSGKNWHTELLNQMMLENEFRAPVISGDLRDHLASYMQFRHFYRHAYSNYLAWEEMKDLWVNIISVWAVIQREIEKWSLRQGTG